MTLPLLPKLDQIVLDADVNIRVRSYLEAVGFDILLSTQEDVNVRSDIEILQWARERNRILVCHDKHRDGHTRMRLFEEIYVNGGKILRIGGRPDQSPITSAGMIMVHRQQWLSFFEEHQSGVATVHRTGCRLSTPDDLRQLIRRQDSADHDPLSGLDSSHRNRR